LYKQAEKYLSILCIQLTLKIILFLNLFQKYYPVKDIVREMKKGKRSKLSSQQVLDQLESVGPNEWEVEHRTHIHKACCSWLMGNCTK
jgi:hypothetical protein